jgi:hypothetical protein
MFIVLVVNMRSCLNNCDIVNITMYNCWVQKLYYCFFFFFFFNMDWLSSAIGNFYLYNINIIKIIFKKSQL